MERTMRELITRLDLALFETALNPSDPAADYKAKLKALQDLQLDPIAGKDPEIRNAIIQRKADLEREAKEKGVGAQHMSPSGKMTNMNANDDDYKINYGKGALK